MGKTEEIAKKIRSFSFFSSMSDLAFEKILSHFKKESFALGGVLAKKGQKLDRAYFIVSGNASSEMKDASGETQKIIHETGAFIGISSFLYQDIQKSDLVCETEVEALSLAKSDFDLLLKDDFEITSACLETFCNNLRTTNSVLVGEIRKLKDINTDLESDIEQKNEDYMKLLHNLDEYMLKFRDKSKENRRLIRRMQRKGQQVATILNTLEVGVVTFNKAGKIDDDYFSYCEQLFGRNDLAGMHIAELLFEHDAINKEQLVRWLDIAFSDMPLSWDEISDLACDKLIPYKRPGRKKERFLELQFNPIYDSKRNAIDSVILVAEDRTQDIRIKRSMENKISQLESQFQEHTESIKQQSGIFEEFMDYALGASEMLPQSYMQLSQNEADSDLVNEMYTTLHNIKGSADMLELKMIGKLSSELEEIIKRLRDSDNKTFTEEEYDEGKEILDGLCAAIEKAITLYSRMKKN